MVVVAVTVITRNAESIRLRARRSVTRHLPKPFPTPLQSIPFDDSTSKPTMTKNFRKCEPLYENALWDEKRTID